MSKLARIHVASLLRTRPALFQAFGVRMRDDAFTLQALRRES
jgi:hypothetical protein